MFTHPRPTCSTVYPDRGESRGWGRLFDYTQICESVLIQSYLVPTAQHELKPGSWELCDPAFLSLGIFAALSLNILSWFSSTWIILIKLLFLFYVFLFISLRCSSPIFFCFMLFFVGDVAKRPSFFCRNVAVLNVFPRYCTLITEITRLVYTLLKKSGYCRKPIITKVHVNTP